MKKLLFLFYIVFCTCLFIGCTGLDDFQGEENQSKEHASLYISQDEAWNISQKVMKHSPVTRATPLLSPNFSYVLNGASTRYAYVPDTLAYVINYPDNGGFTIISSDRRVYPVLGYSYEGNFSFDNEIAKSNFIDNIGSYLNAADINSAYEVGDEDFDECYSQYPKIQSSISQNSPWNKIASYL